MREEWLCLFLVWSKEVSGKVEAPKKLSVNIEHEWVASVRLHHMNMLIFKDVIVRLRLADKLQDKYRGDLAYELGTITASMLDRYRNMLELYYEHTKMEGWRYRNYSVDELASAYHIIHGDYMELLTEKDTFLDILAAHKKKQMAALKRAAQKQMRKLKEQKRKLELERARIAAMTNTTLPTTPTMPSMGGDGPRLPPGMYIPPGNVAGQSLPPGFNAPRGRRRMDLRTHNYKNQSLIPLSNNKFINQSVTEKFNRQDRKFLSRLSTKWHRQLRKSAPKSDIYNFDVSERKGNRDLTAATQSDSEFKRMLRLKKWGENWNYYDPKREGVVIEGVDVDVEEVKKAMRMVN